MDVGDKVRLIKDIWDDGADHHPAGYLAKTGETLVVRSFAETTGIYVSHEHRLDKSFCVFSHEYELIED